MNIGINGYEAVVPRFGYDKSSGLPIRVGSGQYCFELLVNLNKVDRKNNYLIYLPREPTKDMPAESKNWKYKVIGARKAWTLTSLSFELLKKQSNPDVFFSPTHYLPFSSPSKSVISILDVSYLHFPNMFAKKDLYQLKLWGRYSISKAKKIITISESSKSDIIKSYGIPEAKIEVIYPGIKQLSSMEELAKKFGISKEYILFVGTLQPRKNIERLIEAFAKLDRPGLDLVILGKKGWQFEDILNAPRKFDIENQVKFLHEVSDEDLPSFYKNATMFVLPSLYEGFGLPILEAMKYGCPVITSNVSSLPEAGGNAALYVDPKNVDDIASKMQKLLEDKSLREALINKGYKQVEKFSWEKSAQETLAVLEEIGNS